MTSKGIYIGVLSNIFGNCLMLMATLWLTRILSPEEFGQFRVGSNFAVLMIPFLALGSERLISRLIQRDQDDVQSVAAVLVTVCMIVGLGIAIIALGYPLLEEYIFNGEIPPGVYYSSIAIIPLTIFYNIGNSIWRHVGSSSDAQMDLNLIQRIFRAPLLVGSSFLWPNALVASLSMAFAQAISIYRIRRYLIRYFNFYSVVSMKSVAANIRVLLAIGVPVSILAAIDRMDVILINAIMGPAEAGGYDLVYMLALTSMFPAMALSKTSEPFLLNISLDAVKLDRVKVMQTRAFIISCLALLSIGVAGPMLTKFLGNAGPDFAKAALILSAGLAFSGVFGPVFEYLQINGKTRISMIVVLFMLSLFFCLKFFAASAGSIMMVAAFAGLCYFALRSTLALYIFYSDGVLMCRSYTILLAVFGYVAIAIFCFN